MKAVNSGLVKSNRNKGSKGKREYHLSRRAFVLKEEVFSVQKLEKGIVSRSGSKFHGGVAGR